MFKYIYLMAPGISNNEIGEVLHLLKNYTWIFGIVEILLILLCLNTVLRIRQEKKKNAKLLNRYNPDGTECAPRGTFATNISIYVILALLDFAVWFIVANI